MYLISWEEGVEGPEGWLLAKKVKAYILNFQMLRPGIP
jgi:hypothetical protein